MDQEIGFAYARGVKVVSVLRGEVPHGFIGRFQGLKMHSKNLGWEVCKKLRVFQSEAELYIRAVESVQSYDDAVVLAKIQCCLEPLSQDYVDRIVCAAEVNPVLRESVAFWKRQDIPWGWIIIFMNGCIVNISMISSNVNICEITSSDECY